MMKATCVCVCVCVWGLGSDDEVRLIETLFEKKGYNPLIRPVRNLTETVTVKFGLAMIQLINVVCTIHVAQFLFFSVNHKHCTEY